MGESQAPGNQRTINPETREQTNAEQSSQRYDQQPTQFRRPDEQQHYSNAPYPVPYPGPYYSRQPYPAQQQSYLRPPYSQPQIYVLPHPVPPPYSQMYYTQLDQKGQEQQKRPSKAEQENQKTSANSEQHSAGRNTQDMIYQQPPQPIPPPPTQPAHESSMIRPGKRRPSEEEETEPEGWHGFENKKVRTIFVRKVYTILMLQLLFTLGIIALFVFEPNVKRFVQENIVLYYISLAIFISVYLGLACFQSVRRKYPMNIIMLCIFTMAMSYMMGTISSMHSTYIVFTAVGICAVVCFAVTLFSFYTKFDFTTCGSILCILLLVLILFGLISIFIPSKVMTMIYAALGASVFTLFLAYDTQMLMGGKHQEISPEEHIYAAVQIYIDIVYIFMFLLTLLGQE